MRKAIRHVCLLAFFRDRSASSPFSHACSVTPPTSAPIPIAQQSAFFCFFSFPSTPPCPLSLVSSPFAFQTAQECSSNSPRHLGPQVTWAVALTEAEWKAGVWFGIGKKLDVNQCWKQARFFFLLILMPEIFNNKKTEWKKSFSSLFISF